MALGIKETLPVLDLWEAMEFFFRGGQPQPSFSGGKPQPPKPQFSIQPERGGKHTSVPHTSCFEPSDWIKKEEKDPKIFVFEDNQSTITVLEKGQSKKLAHMTRTHRVNLKWLCEVLSSQDITLTYVATADQSADIFTKAFLVPQTWKHLCESINLFDPSEFPTRSEPLVTSCLPNWSCIVMPAPRNKETFS